ncbi:MAG: DM13 domain-containing protein [Nanoarchaeota archaeon]
MKQQHKFLIVLGIIATSIAAWYLASPLFIDKVVNEEILTAPDINQKNQDASIKLTLQGKFAGADSFHQVRGAAKIIEKDTKRYLVLENFESTNGPDLKLYLSTDKKATAFVDLGALKGNIGNQQYEIPKEVDLKKYNYALIWCRAFGVLFGSAELSSG